ncbi:MFS transporter [Pedomonas sp. V897]|uniref:MFS transporter n=1 Tax=Pedomonas sp. V897 TaxID=3446482 RepID=UPI003EE14F14
MSFLSTIQGRTAAVCAVLLLGLNLRPVLSGISPLLDILQDATGINGTVAGLLTTLPILAMGLGALLGETLNNRLGERWGIALGIAAVAAACALRFNMPGASTLIATSVLAGFGIATVQALLPYFVKRTFPEDPGRITALYVTAIMAGAAVGAAASPLLAGWWRWDMALGFWALPALGALLVWQRAARSHRTSRAQPRRSLPAAGAPAPRRRRLWRELRTWELIVYFGVGTGAFTLLLAWLPPYYTALGWSPAAAGFMLGGITLTEVCAGLAISAWIGRFPDRRGPLFLVLVSLLAGLAWLVLAPEVAPALICVLLGVGVGSLFPLTLIVTIDHRSDPAEAGALAAAVQGGGYIIASLMPVLAGMLRDRFDDLTQAWVAMGAGVLLLMGMTLRLSPASYRSR